MIDFFKKSTEQRPNDVKTIRESLLQFIKEQLKKMEGGEGGNIKSLQLFISCGDDEKHMYESALYFDEPDKFKNEEVQRIADDYAVELPYNWTMDINFTQDVPTEAVRIPHLEAALFIQTTQRSIQKSATAYVIVRSGEAEQEIYTILSSNKKTCIGREKKVQTHDGFYRENDIAFPEKSENTSNRFISRAHAHIEYDNNSGTFLLFADEGGIPPRNKIKVRAVGDDNPVKLNTTKIGHQLQEGDQIILGESALLEFTYINTEN